MRLSPVNIIGGWYADTALSWAAMRTVNYLPEAAEVEGTRTLKKLATPPGLRAIVDLGTDAPVRGLEDVEGTLFAVSGDSLFEIDTGFTATNRGNIPGVSRVSMAHNKQGGATAANELAIANGLSGYVYNTATQALVQITDSGFEGASTFDYVDGYISFTDPQGRFWGHSDLNQATSYSTLDRNDAESAPDKILSHIVSHREVIVWGPRTGEFFRNTGAATGTFQRVDGTEMEVGICSTFARARVDNTVVWVGHDLTVYRLNGHSPQRISTRPIEQLLSRVDPSTIFCTTWEDRGHKVCYITSPGNFTIGYDFASGLWHARESYGLEQWRVNALVRWNGLWIAGDYANGLLYALDWNTYTENGRPMVGDVATGYTTADQNAVLAPYVEFIFDTGGDEGTQPAPLSITGDLPDGFVGDTGTMQYQVTGGFPPYGPVTLATGSLPPGATMDSLGLVTYDYSLAGSFAWQPTVTDSVGTIAITDDTAEVQDPPALPLFVAIDNVLTLQKSSDGGATFPTAVTTGLTTTTSTIYTGSADGLLFQFGASTEGRVSSDGGANWSGCVGLTVTSGFNPGDGNLIKVGTEWQLYHWGLHYSTNGNAWSERTISGGTFNAVQRPVQDGAGTVIAVAGGRWLSHSSDSGVTWGDYQIAAFNSSEGVQRLLKVPSGYMAFGRDNSGNLLIGKSATGLTAVSWTTAAGPATALCHGVARDPDTGRIVMVLQTGAVWYTDNEGVNWTAGAAVPYAGAASFPPLQANNMIRASGYFYFTAQQGAGVNRIYRTPDGVTAWAQVFEASPTGNGVNSMCELES